MGQKVNSIGLRLGINKTWSSKWFDEKHYGYLFHEDLKIREYITSIFRRMGYLIGEVQIKRSIGQVFITLSIHPLESKNQVKANPREIENIISQITNNSKISLYILNVSDYTDSANLLAEYITSQLEKRGSFKELLKKSIQKCKSNPRIKGIRINCSGRLDGAEIARTEWVKDGQLSLHTLKANLDYGVSTANTIYGSCGVKVWICYE